MLLNTLTTGTTPATVNDLEGDEISVIYPQEVYDDERRASMSEEVIGMSAFALPSFQSPVKTTAFVDSNEPHSTFAQKVEEELQAPILLEQSQKTILHCSQDTMRKIGEKYKNLSPRICENIPFKTRLKLQIEKESDKVKKYR